MFGVICQNASNVVHLKSKKKKIKKILFDRKLTVFDLFVFLLLYPWHCSAIVPNCIYYVLKIYARLCGKPIK